MWTRRRKAALPGAVATWLAGCMLVLHGASAVGAPPSGNDSTPAKAKPAALAPRHTGQTTYGAPIQPAILHKRHKRSAADSTKPRVASGTNPRHSAAGTKGAGTKASDSKANDTKASDSKAPSDRSLPPDPAYRQPSESAAH